MNRVRGIALLAVGCALAAAAAGTGPYLSKAKQPAPVGDLIRRAAQERQRRYLEEVGGSRKITWFEIAVELVFLVVIVLVGIYLLYRFVLLLRQLVRLRLRRSVGQHGTAEYDRTEDFTDDAVTALRRRVVDELTALSSDLDEMPDPREAVIACYVRMEHAFADAGAARRVNESPMELLSRVLDELYVPEADVRRLTELFAEARFSTHPVTDEMRAAARRSLANVASALAVGA